jgi:hypothetical protein
MHVQIIHEFSRVVLACNRIKTKHTNYAVVYIHDKHILNLYITKRRSSSMKAFNAPLRQRHSGNASLREHYHSAKTNGKPLYDGQERWRMLCN